MRSHQRGAATLLAVILLITVIAASLLYASLYVNSSVNDALQQDDGIAALFLAESGIEHASYNFGLNGACTNAGVGVGAAPAFGRGGFEIVSAAPVGLLCRVQTRGIVGLITRTIQADLSPAGFVEQFLDFSAWGPATITINNPPPAGSNGWDSGTDCPIATCPLTTASGSFVAQTTAGTPNQQYAGHIERSLSTNIVTGGGMNITVSLGFLKANTNPRISLLQVGLVDTGGVETVLWSDNAAPTGAWTAANQVVALPAGRTYGRLRITWDLDERGNNTAASWLDEIRLDAGGSVTVKVWQEI